MITNKPIPIKEYEEFPESISIPKEDLKSFKLNFKNYLDILSENDDSTRQNVILRLKASHYIGIVKLPNNQTFIINPKFKDANFFHMFAMVDPEYARFLTNIVQDITPNYNFIDKLIKNFLNLTQNLIKSFIRKNYCSTEKSLSALKGKILLSETLKSPKLIMGNIVCKFDDFTLDILDNQLIKAALINLKPIANTNQQNLIRQLLVNLENVMIKKFPKINLERIRYNRFNFRYKEVHTYCKMIIEKFSFGLTIGNFKCFSMLLNSWDIYEKFLRNLLTKYLYPEFLVKKITTFSSWDKKKYIPDIIIMRNEKNFSLICDAKYKMAIGSIDPHQGSSYLRYINKLREIGKVEFEEKYRNLLLIYPLNEESNYEFESIEGFEVQEQGIIYAHSIDLSKVDDENYLKSWVAQIKTNFLNL